MKSKKLMEQYRAYVEDPGMSGLLETRAQKYIRSPLTGSG